MVIPHPPPTTPPPAAPFFIIGTERSGSNLLRLILHAHSRIAIPHPPHLLKYFTPLLPGYGDLRQPASLRRLVADVLALLRVHIHPWELEIDPARIVAELAEPSLLGIYFALYDQYLTASGKSRWGCKSTFIIHQVAEVLAARPSAKFLFLVRDPRDVAVSSRQSVFSPFHPYFTARLWRLQQLAGLAWLAGPRSEQFHLVRYEELILAPEGTVRKICAFLGEGYEPAMLEFYRTPAAKRSSSLSTSWRKTAAPIQAGNMNKYREGLKPEELAVVEGVTADLLPRFGYEFSGGTAAADFRPEPPPLTLLRYWLLDRYWFLRMEWHALRRDRNYHLRLRRGILLAWLALKARACS